MSTGGGNTPSPAAGHGVFGSSGAGGFGYGIGVSIGVLLLLAIIASAAFYFCCARAAPAAAAPRHGDVEEAGGGGGGVDEATLEACPAMAYGELLKKKKKQRQETEACCCPVCLEIYGEGDLVRELPDCGHVFHRGCVDPWLRRHATCPVCRTSPLPSPLPTPLAEVAPLARARPPPP